MIYGQTLHISGSDLQKVRTHVIVAYKQTLPPDVTTLELDAPHWNTYRASMLQNARMKRETDDWLRKVGVKWTIKRP